MSKFWLISWLTGSITFGTTLLVATSVVAEDNEAQNAALKTPTADVSETVMPEVNAYSTTAQNAETPSEAATIPVEKIKVAELPVAKSATNDAAIPDQTQPTSNAQQEVTAPFSANSQRWSTGDSLNQVTSVSQLSDVQPTDWAFQALQSLVERYGCIVGYPDGTYRGNRALTRYEFAAGLNACLDRVNELIETATSGLAREDLATLQRLQSEFSAELATLRGRTDALEARTAQLEANQFSTTTKLTGEVIVAVADAFGNDVEDDINTVLHDRIRLNFITSFTGKDRLFTRLQAGNAVPLLAGGPGGNPNTPLNTQEGRFTYDGTNNNENNNDILLDRLDYRFPVGDRLNVTILAANDLHHYYADTVNPFFEGNGGGQNAISRFAERNPIYRIGPLGAGIGFNYKFNDALKIDFGYISNTADNPGEDAGLFNGNYSALAQVVLGNRFKLALTYVHAYNDSGLSQGINRISFGGTGTLFGILNPVALDAATPGGLNQAQLTTPVVSNSYGIEASLPFSPGFVVNGWVGKTDARLINRGDADVWNFAVAVGFPNLGKEGNLLGIVAGAEPTLRGLDVPGPQSFSRDFAYHVEGFYKYQLTDNISVTPGVIWLLSPNQDNNNSDIIIGTLRTTFSF